MKLAYGVATIHGVGLLLLLFFSGWFWRHPAYSWCFLIFLLLLLASWMIFKGCPLTRWENWQRGKVGPEMAYTGQCLVHYGLKLGINIPRRTPLVLLTIMIANAILLFVREVLL